MKNIAIIGAGGFGREVHMLINRINASQDTYNVLGFYDDNSSLPETVNGTSFLGGITELKNHDGELSLVIAVGDPKTKKMIYQELRHYKNFEFPTLVDPSVIMDSRSSTIGIGSLICSNSVITVNVEIKDFVTINLNCTLGHDSVIHSYASLMPSVNVSGEVTIEECVYIGTGATIINQLAIGSNSIIGAGSVVTRAIPANCTAVGAPAKPIKFHD